VPQSAVVAFLAGFSDMWTDILGRLAQVAAWAAAFMAAGEFRTFAVAFYESAVNYTTHRSAGPTGAIGLNVALSSEMSWRPKPSSTEFRPAGLAHGLRRLSPTGWMASGFPLPEAH
jgi:hypothetical protein